MSQHSVYLGLGANIEQPEQQLERALRVLEEHEHITLEQYSHLYISAPVGPQDQPDFINAAAHINTSLSPQQLLAELKHIEHTFGRIKHRHWGERCIDLDILLYDKRVLDTEELTIPHREMHKRAFVLIPLLEIAPKLTQPDGTPLASLPAAKDASVKRYHDC